MVDHKKCFKSSKIHHSVFQKLYSNLEDEVLIYAKMYFGPSSYLKIFIDIQKKECSILSVVWEIGVAVKGIMKNSRKIQYLE